jgi:uncharacterized membrane protein YcaP (DUF421 family)
MLIAKLILLFILTIIIIRLIGHSAMAQLTPHDLTAMIFLVTIAVSPLEVDKVSQSVVGLISIGAIHILLSRLSLFRRFNKLVIGHPVILIKHGKIIKSSLKRSRYSLIELLSSIRVKGYTDTSDIQYAILEPNGEISVLPKEEAQPVTAKKLNLNVHYQGLPIAVVIEGTIQYENLKLIHQDEHWLKKQLHALGYSKIEDIFYATIRDRDQILSVDDGEGDYRYS